MRTLTERVISFFCALIMSLPNFGGVMLRDGASLRTLTATDDGYQISVTYDASAGIPADAVPEGSELRSDGAEYAE